MRSAFSTSDRASIDTFLVQRRAAARAADRPITAAARPWAARAPVPKVLHPIRHRPVSDDPYPILRRVPMNQRDSAGHQVTGATADGLAHFETAAHQLRCYIGDPVASVDAALAGAPQMV